MLPVEIDFFTGGYFRTTNEKKLFLPAVLLKNRHYRLLYIDGCVKTTTIANHFSTRGFLNLAVSDSFPAFFKFSTKIELYL
jgi:hypothetical protein